MSKVLSIRTQCGSYNGNEFSNIYFTISTNASTNVFTDKRGNTNQFITGNRVTELKIKSVDFASLGLTYEDILKAESVEFYFDVYHNVKSIKVGK